MEPMNNLEESGPNFIGPDFSRHGFQVGFFSFLGSEWKKMKLFLALFKIYLEVLLNVGVLKLSRKIPET